MNERMRRFVILGLCNLALLQLINAWALARWPAIELQPFLLFIAFGLGAKILGDTIYFIARPSRRSWRYLDDYLLGDLLVHLRFVFPLACLQSWGASTYLPLFPTVRALWMTPALGVLIWAINRNLVEQAEDGRHSPVGVRAARMTSGKE